MSLWLRVSAFILLAISTAFTLWPGLAPAVPASPSIGVNATLTVCPQATPEPFWVEPVTSPTGALSQTVTVSIGNGEAVTVTAESGVFAVAGVFGAYGNPAQVDVALLPDVIHHLQVVARVKPVSNGPCLYGGYTRSTQQDRNGQPLVIRQITTQ